MKNLSKVPALAIAAALLSGASWADIDISSTIQLGAAPDGVSNAYDQSAVVNFNVPLEDVGKYVDIHIGSSSPLQLNLIQGNRNGDKGPWWSSPADWSGNVAGTNIPKANNRIEFHVEKAGSYTLILTALNDSPDREVWKSTWLAPRDITVPYTIKSSVSSPARLEGAMSEIDASTFDDTFVLGAASANNKGYITAETHQKSTFNWQAYSEEHSKAFNEFFKLTDINETTWGSRVGGQKPHDPYYKNGGDASGPINIAHFNFNPGDRVLDASAWTHEVGHIFTLAYGMTYAHTYYLNEKNERVARYNNVEPAANYFREWIADPEGAGGMEKNEYLALAKAMLIRGRYLKFGNDPDIDMYAVMNSDAFMLMLKNFMGSWDFLINTIQWYQAQNPKVSFKEKEAEEFFHLQLINQIAAIDPAKADIWKAQLVYWGLNYTYLSGITPVDADGDGFVAGMDTDDSDPTISPLRDEYLYTNVDTDLSGFENDGVLVPAANTGENFWMGTDYMDAKVDNKTLVGSHYIQSAATGYCAYAFGGSNAHITTWDCFNSPNMAWTLQPQGSGFLIKHFDKDLCMSASNNTSDLRVRVQTCSATDNKQIWVQNFQANGGFEYQNLSSGKCLAIPGPSYTKGLDLVEETCSGSEFQQWDNANHDVIVTRRRTYLHAGENLQLNVNSNGKQMRVDIYPGNLPYVDTDNSLMDLGSQNIAHAHENISSLVYDAWDENLIYNTGDMVSHQGHDFRAKWYADKYSPPVIGAQYGAWEDLGASQNTTAERHKRFPIAYQTNFVVDPAVNFTAPIAGIYTVEFVGLSNQIDYAHPVSYVRGSSVGNYTVAISTNGVQVPDAGQTYPNASAVVPANLPFTITARSKMGYALAHFLVDGQVVQPDNADQIGPKTLTLPSVTANTSIQAVFKPEVRLTTSANIVAANKVVQDSRWDGEGETFVLSAPAQVDGRNFQGWSMDASAPATITASYLPNTTVVVNGDVNIEAVYDTYQHLQSLNTLQCLANNGGDITTADCSNTGTLVRWEQLDSLAAPGYVQIQQFNAYGMGGCLRTINNLAGSAVEEAACNDVSDQQWEKIVLADGKIRLQNNASNLCLSVSDTGDIVQASCADNSANSHWRFTSRPADAIAVASMKIKNTATGRCIDSELAGTEIGRKTIEYFCSTNDSFLWSQIPSSTQAGLWMLKQDKSQNCLSVSDQTAGSYVVLNNCDDTDAVLWTREVQADGSIKYQNAYSNLCLNSRNTPEGPYNFHFLTQESCSSTNQMNWLPTLNP